MSTPAKRDIITKLLRDKCSAAISSYRARAENARELDSLARNKKIAQYFERCATDTTNMSGDEQIATFFATYLESGCYRHASNPSASFNIRADIFDSIYSARAHRIIDMLEDEACELIDALVKKRVCAARVAAIPAFDICPSILRKERDQYNARLNQKLEVKTSSAYVCRKCGEKKTTIREALTRSPDEPPTLFITCTVCTHKWHINS